MFRAIRRLVMSETINVEDYNIVKEGKAEILAPKEDKVFYNHIQQFNRDLSVLAINAYSELRNEKQTFKQGAKKRKLDGISILEALSATGLRAIRYGHEIPSASKIVANDLLPEAVKSINRNIEYNKLTDKVRANHGDAIKYMASTSEKFHVVDLDPYGTAAPFIDGAIQCIHEDGLLLVTCTDAGVLAGSGYPEKCFALYGGNNFGSAYINSECNHEVGIRLILNQIANTAAKYKKTIEPLLCLSIDYYFRLFIRVKTSPINVKHHASKTVLAYGCNGCGHKLIQPLGAHKKGKYSYPKVSPGVTSQCEYCGDSFNLAGPMYGSSLQNHDFIDKVLALNSAADTSVYGTCERIKGMLTLAKKELDLPFYFNLNHLSSMFKSSPISIDEFVKALGSLGYQVSLTHAKRNCIKTDAPWDAILQINKTWMVEQNKKYLETQSKKEESELNDKTKEKINRLKEDIAYNANLSENSPGAKILSKLRDINLEVDFHTENDISLEIGKLRKVKMVRFQENPTKDWGPKARPSKK